MKETERRLKAIMFSDIKSFSLMMGSNEERTVKMVREYRKILREILAKYHGEERGTSGDSLFVLFDSAIESVKCAEEIQVFMHKRNKKKALTSPKEQIWIRIGIHLGEVIYDTKSDDVFGDDINIASRVEELADAGGIAITQTVKEQASRKLDIKVTDLGCVEMKNIKNIPSVYKIDLEFKTTAAPKLYIQKDKPKGLVTEIFERRILQALAGYLAISWGLIEAGSFFTNRFNLPDLTLDILLMLLFSGIPICLTYTWFHAMPGKQKFETRQHVKAFSGFVIFFLTGVLFFVLNLKSDSKVANSEKLIVGSSQIRKLPLAPEKPLNYNKVNTKPKTLLNSKIVSKYGSLYITVDTPVEVRIRRKGTSSWKHYRYKSAPLRIRNLEKGDWEVEFSSKKLNKDYKKMIKEAKIKVGRTTDIDVKMELKSVKFVLKWFPKHSVAILFYISEYKSKVRLNKPPLKLNNGEEIILTPGNFSVNVKCDGFRPTFKKLSLKPGESFSDTINLAKFGDRNYTSKHSPTWTVKTPIMLYDEYTEAYKKLNELMKDGKGDSPEAQDAYFVYKKAKIKYETAIKKK